MGGQLCLLTPPHLCVSADEALQVIELRCPVREPSLQSQAWSISSLVSDGTAQRAADDPRHGAGMGDTWVEER